VVAGWGGAASSTHLAASGGRVLALDNVIGADGATGSGFGGAADTSQSGRNGMTGVVDDTRRGVAAIAPSTDTPAGKRQLVDHLQLELDRAKSLLKVSEQRNVMLAQLRCVVIGGLETRSGRPGSDGGWWCCLCCKGCCWERPHECRTPFRYAETLNKAIVCARLEPVPDRGIASKWQRCDLSGDGQATAISVDEGEPILLATEGLRRQLGGLRALGIGALTDHTWRYRCTRSR
jgi:hypothetical protein